ncbi:MAG: SlyX family protein [Pseudomonadota bacterium]
MSNEEERFVDIELKLVHQEDLVDALNQRVYEQQQQIDKLEAMLHSLAQHVRDNAQGGQQGILNERPPHY